MFVSELIEALKNKPANAQVLVTEGGNLTVITSVVEDKSETAVVLAGKAFNVLGRGKASQLLKEAATHGDHGRIFNTEVSASPNNPGKFIVSIDGNKALCGQFDTPNEAKACTRGFVLGFQLGSGVKNMGEGRPPTIG
jgi:hypothetical protein